MAGAVVTSQTEGLLLGVRIVFFGVSDRPLQAKAAAKALEAKSPTDVAAVEAACQAISGLDFHNDLNTDSATKAHLSKVVFKRALQGMVA